METLGGRANFALVCYMQAIARNKIHHESPIMFKQFVSVCILSSDRIQPSSISGLLSIPWTQAAPASASKSPTCPSLSWVEQHCTFSTQKGKTGLHAFVIGRSGNIHGIMAWIHHPQTQFNGCMVSGVTSFQNLLVAHDSS